MFPIGLNGCTSDDVWISLSNGNLPADVLDMDIGHDNIDILLSISISSIYTHIFHRYENSMDYPVTTKFDKNICYITPFRLFTVRLV